MVSGELLDTLQGLTRADQLYIMQVLISQLAREEADLIKPDQSYPVWSPYDAFEAANTMLEVLQETKTEREHPGNLGIGAVKPPNIQPQVREADF